MPVPRITSHVNQKSEIRRLRAALSAIHNLLHAGDVNGAHEACECAIQGKAAKQANLSQKDSAAAMTFAGEFNALVERHDARACAILLLPSATVPNAVSLQIMGEVQACKIVEAQLRGQPSTYMGDHEPAKGGHLPLAYRMLGGTRA